MEALSPRSTNVPPRTKVTVKRAKQEQENAHMQKTQTSKNHAPPPPPLVTEPGENGESYSTGAFLGKGGFAVCYEGKLNRNGRVFALKVVKSEMNQRKMAEKFRTELQIHSKMRHPNVVEFHRAFAFEKNTYVVLEICPNGSVMDMVRKRKCLSLPEVRRFMVQLCGAVKYLHKRKVAHRDLKMGNLFLDKNMDIKVGDFGLAAIIVTEKDAETARRRTLCGTPNYIAPEVLDKSKGGHTQKVDIWSLGVICFAMLTGYPPFQSKTQEEIYKKVRNLNYVWPKDSSGGNYIPTEAKSLVSACLSLSEEERPEPDQIVDHEFFNMYSGCIPGSLDPVCRFSKPEWIKHEDPLGDKILGGHSLAFDQKYSAKCARLRDPEQRYALCRNEFYAECGVGRGPTGQTRKSIGKNCSKTAYSECIAEDERGLQPMIPLPEDQVYKYHVGFDGDWSLGREILNEEYSIDGVLQDNIPPRTRSASLRNQPPTARTQAALAAQLRRKEGQPQSHAAALRQQALPPREPAKRSVRIPQTIPQPAPNEFREGGEPRHPPVEPQGLLGGRPIRTRSRTADLNSASLREKERTTAPPLPQANTISGRPTVSRTRSQSKQQAVAEPDQIYPNQARIKADIMPDIRPERKPSAGQLRPEDDFYQSVRSLPQGTIRMDPKQKERYALDSAEYQQQKQQRQLQATLGHGQRGTSSSSSKSASSNSTSKPRSTLGVSPLIHPDENAETLPGTSSTEVLAEVRLMLGDLNQRSSSSTVAKRRRRFQSPSARHGPHPYVVKWVDYTNRYGIGYVLDDGSVGCVFKAENGRPASCVVVRDGERHIRRKARCQEQRRHEDYDLLNAYSESNQLVPRNGKPVEFYESYGPVANGGLHLGTSSRDEGIRRVLVESRVFEVKTSSNGSGSGGIKVRMDAGVESARCEAEKVKRIKLVDQFGKYMIGALGRAAEDQAADEQESSNKGRIGQYIKFYQRLGNVGVWGFGDGAFQFNFPDHTKLVLSRRRTDPTETNSSGFSTWVDFYHLAPRAARYLATKGRMHPSGFDTRAVAFNEIGVFLDAASGYSDAGRGGPGDEHLAAILDANSFLEKINFIGAVLKGWVRAGRMGEMPSPSSFSCSLPSSSSSGSLSSAPTEAERSDLFFWEGVQEGSIAGNNSTSSNSGSDSGKISGSTKFVWVTVGAQGGDREYLSMSLDLPLDLRPRRVDSRQDKRDGGEGQDLKERIRGLTLER